MKHNSIPILFGITGHRDLRPNDISYLKQAVRKILKKYQDQYPNTEIILISALAEGADMLTAEVARDLGITLKVVIPYEESEYLKSFESKDAIKQYKSLSNYADGDPVFPPSYSKKTIDNKELCYQILGEYLADTSNILIALYDGIETGKLGGTSAIIRYARKGKRDNIFDPLDGDSVFIINTPRISNTKIKKPFVESREFLGVMDDKQFHAMLNKIDQANHSLKVEIATAEGHSLLEKMQKYFDDKANQSQTRYKKHMVVILLLTGLGIFFLELMHNLTGVFTGAGHFIIGYALGIGIAFIVYWFLMRKGQLQDDFVFSRAFGEAIRIQNAWNDAGLKQSVSKYYLANQANKFAWIRTALKNLYFINNKAYKTKEDWIEGQINYLNNTLPEREKKHKFYKKLEDILLFSGIASLLVMFLIYVCTDVFHVLPHLHYPLNWHFLVLVSGFLLLLAGFIKKYVSIHGIEEDVYNFRIMKPNFEKAQALLNERPSDKKLHMQIIFDLGKKALEENSKWVELHDARRVKPEVE